jgi:hypothetical protein
MGMVPRGEVALIIAGLGLSKGYLTSEVFGIGILMTLITTVVAPPGLVALFIPTKRGVNKPKASMDNSRVVKFELEKKQIADLMLQKLITQFNKEGCFTSLLSSEDQIWHVSMDKLEISLHRNGSCIEIECTPDEESFVLQAWTEVLSQMNELAQTLAKPIQRNEEFLKDSILNHEDIGKVKKNHIFKQILRDQIGTIEIRGTTLYAILDKHGYVMCFLDRRKKIRKCLEMYNIDITKH